jgi:hypothetical protein
LVNRGHEGPADHPCRPVSGRADDPLARLKPVADRVAELEAALGTGSLARSIASANKLVAGTTTLLEELDVDHKGHGDDDSDAELIAALRVYRNAAFAFRKLARSGGEPDPTLEAVCSAMIEQGHDHLRVYRDRVKE